jgi:hypothetical protein
MSVLGLIEKVHPCIRQNFELGATKCWNDGRWKVDDFGVNN